MIELKYMNNFQRNLVGQLDIKDIPQGVDIAAYILNVFQRLGCKSATEPTHLYIAVEGNTFQLEKAEQLPDATVIFYSDVIVPENAYRYDQFGGIEYLFRTNEGNHIASPHIHARYDNFNICIFFSNFRVEGHFRKQHRRKEREAVNYVKEHLDELQAEWNKIMQSQGVTICRS
jgi:hypothetical protein